MAMLLHTRPSLAGVETGKKKEAKTYNIEDSLVVTDPTTSSTLARLSRGERTGSRVFERMWSYVLEIGRGEVNEWAKHRSLTWTLSSILRRSIVRHCVWSYKSFFSLNHPSSNPNRVRGACELVAVEDTFASCLHVAHAHGINS